MMLSDGHAPLCKQTEGTDALGGNKGTPPPPLFVFPFSTRALAFSALTDFDGEKRQDDQVMQFASDGSSCPTHTEEPVTIYSPHSPVCSSGRSLSLHLQMYELKNVICKR